MGCTLRKELKSTTFPMLSTNWAHVSMSSSRPGFSSAQISVNFLEASLVDFSQLPTQLDSSFSIGKSIHATRKTGPCSTLLTKTSFLLFMVTSLSKAGPNLASDGCLNSDLDTGGTIELLYYAILSVIILDTFRVACFTGLDSTTYFFPLEEVKSSTSFSIVDRPSHEAEEVEMRIFFIASKALGV